MLVPVVDIENDTQGIGLSCFCGIFDALPSLGIGCSRAVEQHPEHRPVSSDLSRHQPGSDVPGKLQDGLYPGIPGGGVVCLGMAGDGMDQLLGDERSELGSKRGGSVGVKKSEAMDLFVLFVRAARKAIVEMVRSQEETAISTIQRDVDFAVDNWKEKRKQQLEYKIS